ncbi:MAG: ABC transporter ATP-binding protein [Candidatus Sungbacteria bacterium]|nr:ABC transporter ATP-binding protein [Candidatus Sungbacteria bacterium]
MFIMRKRQEKKPLNRNIVKSVIRVFFQHAKKYPYAAGIVMFSVISVTLLEITASWYSKKFFDTLSAGLAPEVAFILLIQIVIALYGIISAAEWVGHRLWGFANTMFEAYTMRDLENTAFANLIGHSYRFFADNFTGSLVRKVRRLSRSFEEVADNVEDKLLALVVAIAGVLTVLFQRYPILGALLSVWVIFFVFLYYRIAIWKMKYDLEKAEKDSETTGVLSDALANIVTIKLFSREEHEKSLFGKVLDEFTRIRLFTWRVNVVTDAVQGGLMLIINFILMYTAVRLWRDGRITIGDFALIQGVLMVIFHRIWDFGRVVRKIYESFADASEMVEIMETPYEVKDKPGVLPIAVSRGAIEFRNVGFNFRGTRKILDDFNLSIAAGEKIALVGPSGAGKTTVVSLLLRFHDVADGGIFIDGQNIASVTQESLRRNIALVPQEPILFHRALKENIRYGRPDATDEMVIEAAMQANCHQFISGFPDGYDTYVGERGVKLSGGERQRVAIARAILASTPVLILDEATSSLDSEVESLIQEAMKNLMRKKTAIVIAHRLSTIVQMDRIVVIDEGKIVEMGKHDELLEHDGIYKRLWTLQAERFIG